MRSFDVNRPRSGKRVSPRIEVIIPAGTLAEIDAQRSGTRTAWVPRAIRLELNRVQAQFTTTPVTP